MRLSRNPLRAAGGLALAATILVIPATAQNASNAFYRAYYLETAQGDLSGALELYERVAEARRGDVELRAAAAKRARAVAEDLASRDLASLVPADTIFYLELNRPGEQLKKLLGQLGLLNGAGAGAGFGISPLLVDGVFGLGGVAVAVTGIDPRRGPDKGVMILHPGDLDTVRGLLETVLPLGGQPVDSIGGFPTYDIEGEALVALTDKLVVVSRDRQGIEGVVGRLAGRGRSLADSEAMASTMAMRGDDLGFFCVNFEPIMPMIKSMIESQTRRDPGARAALAFLDIDSTRSIAGRMGVDDDGLSMDIGLVLDEGHKNLAFNLLRMPNVDEDTLKMVPAGAAFFVAGAVNEAGETPPGATDAEGNPVVTFMDFGREVFANLADFAFYAMPTVSRAPWGPTPDLALALTVNDPERSKALWRLVLGTAQVATGGSAEQVVERGEGGGMLERFEIRGVPVLLASRGKDMIVSFSESAIMSSIEARSAGRTVLQDPAYAGVLEHFSGGSVRAGAINIGRCGEIASAFMNDRERREAAPFIEMLRGTSASFSIQQTSNRLGASARVCGIPNIGPMVSRMIQQHLGHRAAPRRITVESRGQPRQAPAAARRAPAPTASSAPAARAMTRDELRDWFQELHADGRKDQARKVGKAVHEAAKDDAEFLNVFAWNLLTEEEFGNEYDDLALELSRTSNDLTEWSNWFYLDTYATALFQKGSLEEAIEVEKKAIEAGADHPRIGEARATLERFLNAAKKQKTKKTKIDD